MAPTYDKMVKPRNFMEGNFVFKKILPFKEDPREKFNPNFEGPYIVTKVLSRGAIYLAEIDGDPLPEIFYSDSVKKYFVLCFSHYLK